MRASYVVRGAGISVSAMPVATPVYGAGAWAKSSCQVNAFAGRITMVSEGTVTRCPLMVMKPPWCAPTPGPLPGPPSVADWMNPVMSNCDDAGTGSCATATPTMARRLKSRTVAKRKDVFLLLLFMTHSCRLVVFGPLCGLQLLPAPPQHLFQKQSFNL